MIFGLYFIIILPENIVVTYVIAAPNLTIESLNFSTDALASSLLTTSPKAVHILENSSNFNFAFVFHSSNSSELIAGIESFIHIQYVFSQNITHLSTLAFSTSVKGLMIPIVSCIKPISQRLFLYFGSFNNVLKGSGGVNLFKGFISFIFFVIFALICCGLGIYIYIIMIFF